MITNSENNEKSKETIAEQTQIKFIRCPECGEKIPMAPNLEMMIEAIDNHVGTHRKQPHDNLAVAHLKTPTISMDLTKQVLQRAADMVDPDVIEPNKKPSIWL